MSTEKLNIPGAVAEHQNQLFPVFLKLENMRVLVVGGGKVGLEKLHAILHNAPGTGIRLVALAVSDAVRDIARKFSNV